MALAYNVLSLTKFFIKLLPKIGKSLLCFSTPLILKDRSPKLCLVQQATSVQVQHGWISNWLLTILTQKHLIIQRIDCQIQLLHHYHTITVKDIIDLPVLLSTQKSCLSGITTLLHSVIFF